MTPQSRQGAGIAKDVKTMVEEQRGTKPEAMGEIVLGDLLLID